jgi:hypothetical protein
MITFKSVLEIILVATGLILLVFAALVPDIQLSKYFFLLVVLCCGFLYIGETIQSKKL